MKKILVILLAGNLLFGAESALAQGLPAKTFSFSYQKAPLITIIKDLEQKFEIRIFYREEWVAGQTVSFNLPQATLEEGLKAALAETSLTFERYDIGNLVLLPAGNFSQTGQVLGTSGQAGKNQFDSRAEIIGGVRMAPRGQKLNLTGSITGEKTGEPIIGARISVDKLGIGTVTDLEGNFKLVLEAGKYEISFSAIGVEPVKKLVQLNNDGTFYLKMRDKAVALDEVRVEAIRKDQNVSGTQMGVAKLDIREIKIMPSLLGEADILKSVQMLPGVTSVGEAAAGFNVRGGNTDQNLILLDEVPLFNPTHLFGFFSAFNPDAVQDVTFYRGAIPAQLGGRLSSILDVKQKEGNLEKWNGSGGVGLITSRLAVEGPVMEKKGSVLAAVRSSYTNWLFKTLPVSHLRDNKAAFYDGTIKFSGLISERNKLSFSVYRSHDSFQFDPDTVYTWNTNNASVTFNHIFSENLQVNLVGIYGNYDLKLDYLKPFSESRYNSGIRQRGLKADFSYRQSKHTIRFGGASTYYILGQGNFKPTGERSIILPEFLPDDKALESAIFINDEIEISPILAFTLGLRYSFYQNLGPGLVYQYKEGQPKSLITQTDTVAFKANSLVKAYDGLEPRLAMRLSLNEKNSIKASYSRTRQYLHVVSNTLTISPIDIWKASNPYIKPQIGDQVSLGIFRNWKQNAIESSIEVYYKAIQNQLDYKDGADLFMSPALETEVVPAAGKAYGIEFMVSKKVGFVTGWASYGYSRSFLKTNSVFEGEKINENQEYRVSYDKPHNLNLALAYNINRRFTASANFVYSTGRPFTAATAHYVIEGNVIPFYGPRNAYRLPDYHRLDVSLTVLPSQRKVKKWESSWNLSLYNVYGRKNIYSAFYRYIYGSKPQAYNLSVVGTIVPSITYNFKF